MLGGYWSAYWYDGRIYGTEIKMSDRSPSLISIVVPVFNEVQTIDDLIGRLRATGPATEPLPRVEVERG